MCNWQQEFQKYQSQGWYQPEKVSRIPSQVVRDLNLDSAYPGVCPFCHSSQMSPEYMLPQGRMPRHLCNSCFEATFRRVNTQCVVCKHPLPQDKVQGQQRNWREPENHIHDSDACRSIWALLHGIITRAHPTFREMFGNAAPQQPGFAQLGQQPAGWQQPAGALGQTSTGDGFPLNMNTHTTEREVIDIDPRRDD